MGNKWKTSLQRKTIICKFSTSKFYKRNVWSQNHCFYRKHLSNSWGKTNKQTNISHKHVLHFHTVEKLSQTHLEWSSLHCTPEQRLISQKTKKMMVLKPLAIGYIFSICSSNTQEEEGRKLQRKSVSTNLHSKQQHSTHIHSHSWPNCCGSLWWIHPLNLTVKGITTNGFSFFGGGQFCSQIGNHP